LQSRFAQGETCRRSTSQCRGWWNELGQECKTQADPDNTKGSQKVQRSSQGSLPSRPAPSPTFSRRADESLPRLENIEMVVWPSANIDDRDPCARLNRGRPFRWLHSCTASSSSVEWWRSVLHLGKCLAARVNLTSIELAFCKDFVTEGRRPGR